MITQGILKVTGFATALSDYMQPEQASSLKIEDAESESTAIMLSNGITIPRTMLKVSQPVTIALNSNNLKTIDAPLYKALSKAGEIGSGATWVCGLESRTYTKVIVNNPLKSVNNSGEDNEVTLTFCGSGKR